MVLEVGVKSVGLDGRGVNPSLRLGMEVHARLIRTADGREVYFNRTRDGQELYFNRGFMYRDTWPGPEFIEWAASNARPFREGLERAGSAVAEEIVDELSRSDALRELFGLQRSRNFAGSDRAVREPDRP